MGDVPLNLSVKISEPILRRTTQGRPYLILNVRLETSEGHLLIAIWGVRVSGGYIEFPKRPAGSGQRKTWEYTGKFGRLLYWAIYDLVLLDPVYQRTLATEPDFQALLTRDQHQMTLTE